ncbi:MAG: hypothetical protein BGO95_08720 [Micrococcales bacterium 73-13]|nr:MAG: hypothetical protein BGO95_08720 [Micrococcales bacterium 73-13]
MSLSTSLLRLGAAVGAVALVSSVAACSTGGGTAPTDAPAPAPTTVQPIEYDGPEAAVPAEYGEPKVVDGFTFTLGWLSPNTSNPFVNAIAMAGQQRTEELGGRFIVKNANNSVNTQVDQCNELLAQGVDAMAVYAVDPSALGPCLADAAEAGIPIIGQDTPPIVGTDLFEHFLSNVSQGPDRSAHSIATLAAQAAPAGAKFATLGLGIPIPLLKYYIERLQYWGEQYGMEYVGNVDAATDVSQDMATATNDILTRWPDVQVIMTFNGPSAAAASTTARASGVDGILVFGNGGDKTELDMVKSGQMAGTNRLDTEAIGTQMINGLYNVLTDQNLPLAPQLAVIPLPVTSANVDSVKPF